MQGYSTNMKSSIDKFTVVLEEPKKIYSSGEDVHGKVVLVVKKEIKFWNMTLECLGEAYVSWPENNGTYTRYRYAREELFCVKSHVGGNTKESVEDKGFTTSVLKPSVYSFFFRLTIPRKDLPPSYEARHGYIRYTIQASIEKKKGKSRQKSAGKVFTIGNYNEYSEEESTEIKEFELKSINGKSTTASLGASCYSAGRLYMYAHTNKLLYHPGEVITTYVVTENEAVKGMCSVEASLVRLTTYNDGKSNKTYSKHELVRTEKEDGLEEDGLELVLPVELLQPTMLLGCKYIAINYFVQVRIQVNGKLQNKPVLMIPVLVAPSQASYSPRTTETDSALNSHSNRSNSSFTESESKNEPSRFSSTSTSTVCFLNSRSMADDERKVLDTWF